MIDYEADLVENKLKRKSMTSKVLVADDSLTIQKVINITLANSGYELVECLNEQDLLNKVESNSFDLVLLDFNLSDTTTGYDLSKKIKAKNPNAAIVVMLGTFDSVDDSQFKNSGITDKIIKPFESSKFIKKCKDALENRDVSEVDFDNSTDDSLLTEEESLNLDSWTIDAPSTQKEDTVDFNELDSAWDSSENMVDPLTSEIQGWGFSSDSLENKFQKEFPSQIEDFESTSDHVLKELQSSSDFNFDDAGEELILGDETNPAIELDTDNFSNMALEIESEISDNDFWALDEVDESNKEVIENNFNEITADLTETVQSFRNSYSNESAKETSREESSHNASYNINTIDEEALVAKIKDQLRPMIEEIVKQYCTQQVERVAWEVIPDLAENLIKKEIKEISDSITTH